MPSFICTSCHAGAICFGPITQGACSVCGAVAVGTRCDCKPKAATSKQ